MPLCDFFVFIKKRLTFLEVFFSFTGCSLGVSLAASETIASRQAFATRICASISSAISGCSFKNIFTLSLPALFCHTFIAEKSARFIDDIADAHIHKIARSVDSDAKKLFQTQYKQKEKPLYF